MKEKKPIFPTIQRTIESFIEDEEGGIPANRLMTIGTLIVLLSSLLSMTAFAGHSSHKSHSSHSSHSSSSYHRSHVSHTSHSSSLGSHSSSHGSHASHSSHSSHSNTTRHSNSNYSSGGDYGTPSAPEASSIIAPPKPASLADSFNLPSLDIRIESPESSLVGADIVLGQPIQTPLGTPSIHLLNQTIETVPETPTQ